MSTTPERSLIAPRGDTAELVSVVIPTFNRSMLLVRAIESARRQSYSRLEILVVDDASTDDTLARVECIPDPRVRYLRHATNCGGSAARNTGIRAAVGNYIAFLDDDDEWREDKIALQIRAMKDFDAVLCTSVVDGRPTRVHRGPRVTLADLRKGSFHTSGLLAKADVLKDVSFDDRLQQAQDWDLLIRVGQRYRIGWIDEPLVLYNRGSHARITNENKHLSGAELEARAAVLHKHREFFGDKWFRYHHARALLSHIGSRRNRLQSIRYAVQSCGVVPVAADLINRAKRKLALVYPRPKMTSTARASGPHPSASARR